MSGAIQYITLTEQQKTDIRDFCGFPAYGDGDVVFPAPWIMRQYIALEYRMNHLSVTDGYRLVNTYLANLYALESAIPAASATLNVDTAAVFKRNANEVKERERLFTYWRLRLCKFMDIKPGPGIEQVGSGTVSLSI